MREDEIKKGIQLICDTSKEMSRYYNDKSALIDKLNSLGKDDLAPLENEFKTPGPVVDLRKEILKYLLEEGKLDEQTFESFIHKHRTGNETKFASFTEFLMFQQFIAPYKHKQISKFIEQFKDEIVERLELKTKVKHSYIDFQGRPHKGIEQFWLAIYNSKQELRSARVQLFIEFQDCKIKYGIRRRRQSDKLYRVDGLQELDFVNFDFEALISLFEENKELVLKDDPKKEPEDILTIPLAGNKLYKISHGDFKAKKHADILNTFKQNHWVGLHEKTGKWQGERFKNDLRLGDYLYITVGADELFAIAKIISDSWEYVPEGIVFESGWIYREVEYVKYAIKTDPYGLMVNLYSIDIIY